MSKPRILWIPHTAWERCAAQRPQLLVQELRDRYEVHVVTWSSRDHKRESAKQFYLNPMNHLRALQLRTRMDGDLHIHHLTIPLPVIQSIMKNTYPPDWVLVLPQLGFQRSIRRLHRQWKFDAAVIAPSHHITGYPPRLPGVPVVLDYLDASPPREEARFVREADAVVSVSHHLADQVSRLYGRQSEVIPNGLYIDRIRAGCADRARHKWPQLVGKKVISLIGMTCSPSLYFLDSIASVMKEFPDIIFLGAGGGSVADAIERRCRELGIPTLMTGWVDPKEVPDLFAVSDIGLYPGDDNPYFDGACPLKVLEYTGARVPVVVNAAKELRRLNMPSLIICSANADAFADGLRQALRNPPQEFTDMTLYDWSRLGRAFGDVVDRVLAQRPKGIAS
jgi:glycosyltransferase involved in cell wall biosynthesis